MWHGYVLIEIDTPLTDAQKKLAIDALLELGRRVGLPHQITHLCSSVDGQKIILELQTPVVITKAQVCNKLAELLPWTSQRISDNTTFTKSPGANWEERRQATVAYKGNNKAMWGELDG